MEINNIPIAQLKWIRSDKEREEVPASFFLVPSERKFPYKNKDGSLNCNLLRAAITRAAQYDYTSVEAKARKLYETNCKVEESEFMLNVVEMSEAKLDGKGFWYNVLPTKTFYDPRYGKIVIDKEFVKRMAENFNKGIPHFIPSLYLGHGERAAYGDVQMLEAKDDGLYAYIVPTDEGKEIIKKKRFKYLSAEFVSEYKSKENQEKVGPVFLGVALTNTPAHPSVVPIKLMSESFNHESEEDTSMELKELLEETKKELSEEKTAKKELEENIKTLSEEKTKLEKELAETKKELSEKNELLFEQKKETWVKEWVEKGTPPNAVKKFAELVENEEDMKKFDAVLEELPKIELEQKGTEVTKANVSNYETEGKKIAESV